MRDREERRQARRVEVWLDQLLAGRTPSGRLRTAEERRAAAAALRLHAPTDARPSRALQERLRAIPVTAEDPAYPRRRDALRWLAGAAALLAGGLLAARGVAARGWIPVGRLADFPVGAVRPVMAARTFAFVVHDPAGLRALSGTCTHLACPLQYAAGALQCPCHGAKFNLQGQWLPQAYGNPLTPLPTLPLRVRAGRIELQVRR